MNARTLLVLFKRYIGLLMFIAFAMLAIGWLSWAVVEAIRFPWTTPITPATTPYIVGGLLLISVGLAPVAMFSGLAHAGWRWFRVPQRDNAA